MGDDASANRGDSEPPPLSPTPSGTSERAGRDLDSGNGVKLLNNSHDIQLSEWAQNGEPTADSDEANLALKLETNRDPVLDAEKAVEALDDRKAIPALQLKEDSTADAEPSDGQSSPESKPAHTFPEGGLVAWSQVLIPWVIIGSTIGVCVNQYGVFLDYWKTNQSFGPDASLFQLSFGSAIAVGISVIVSPFAGRFAERGHFRAVGVFGGVLFILGYTLAGFASAPWQIYITIGVLFGTGFGCIFTTAIVLPSHYFNKRRGFAVGITITGTGTFGFAFGPALATSLERLGWQWTMRIIGLGLGTVSTLMACFMKPRIFIESSDGKFFDWRHLKRKEFWVFATVQACEGFWYYPLYYYLPIHGTYNGLSPAESAMLVSVLQIAGLGGRIVLGYSFDKFGHMNGFTLSYALSMLGFFVFWPFAKTYGVLIGFSIIMGLTVGGYVSMLLTSFADSMGAEDLATSSAMMFFCGIFSQFFGGPLAGVLVGSQTTELADGTKVVNWVPMMMWAGASMAPGLFALIWLRQRQAGGKLKAVV